MSMNKLLLNIAVSALSITSISYGSEDVSSIPTITGSTIDSTAPADLSSVKSSIVETPILVGNQWITITDSTPKEYLILLLRYSAEEIDAIRIGVKKYFKEFLSILNTDDKPRVKPHSDDVKSSLIELVKSLKSGKNRIVQLEAENRELANSLKSGEDRIVQLEAENRELAKSLKSGEDRIVLLEAENREVEKTLSWWKYGMIVSSVVIAFIYQTALYDASTWFFQFMNSTDSFDAV